MGSANSLNNVETWSNIPLIINRGAHGSPKIGTGDVIRTIPGAGAKEPRFSRSLAK